MSLTAERPDLTEAQKVGLRCLDDFPFFAATCLKIRDKNGAIIPFRLNHAQRHLHAIAERQEGETGRVRIIVVKGRQLGSSSYIQGRFYWRLWRSSAALRAFILTHHDEATENIFGMAQRFQELMPDTLRPEEKRGNAKQLIFAANDCGYQVATAGSRDIGRSFTIQLLHGSEVPSWPNAEEHVVSLLSTALSKGAGTESWLESTAKGIGNVFYRMAMAASRKQSEYELVFVPWFWGEDYRDPEGWPSNEPISDEWLEYGRMHDLDWEQLRWAYLKNRELAQAKSLPTDTICADFKQEFPACIAADQRVGTQRGLHQISEVRAGDIVSDGHVIADLDNGERDLIVLTTSLGYRLKCTPDHLLETEEGNWVMASDSRNTNLRLRSPMFAADEDVVRWRPLPSVESSIQITPEVGRFLGYFMGDGSWGQKGGLSICCEAKDEDVVADVSTLVRSVMSEPTTRRVGTKKGGIEVRANSRAFGSVLQHLGATKTTPPYRKVCVPDCIWTSPRKVVREFLRGLFESDGFAGWGAAKVSLFSKHVEFLRDVQILLLGFGITARLSSENKTNPQGRTYVGNSLTLRSAETRRFMVEIGFVSRRKTERLADYKPCGGRGRPEIGIAMCDRVVSIEAAGRGQVYDLTVSPTHKFDANGFSVHNCFEEAFQTSGDSFIPGPAVLRARKPPEPIIGRGPVIIGIDPARDRDLVGIIDRCGRRMGERICETWKPEGDTVYLAQKIAGVLDRIKPAAANIDIGSNGAGVYDELVAMGYGDILNAVNFGSAPVGRGPTGDRMYLNRRAEMHDLMRDWFETPGGVQVPDNDIFHQEITAAVWGPSATRYNTSNALVIEEKQKIVERIGYSPGLNDAAVLTFAVPLSSTMTVQSQAPRQRKVRNRRSVRNRRGGY